MLAQYLVNVKYWGFLLAYFPSETSVPTLENLKTKQKGNNHKNLCQSFLKICFNLVMPDVVMKSSPVLPTVSATKKKETAADRKSGELWD